MCVLPAPAKKGEKGPKSDYLAPEVTKDHFSTPPITNIGSILDGVSLNEQT